MLSRKLTVLLAILAMFVQAGLAVSHGGHRMGLPAGASSVPSSIDAAFNGTVSDTGAWIICTANQTQSTSGNGGGKHGKSGSFCPICAGLVVAFVSADDTSVAIAHLEFRELKTPPPSSVRLASIAHYWPPNRGPPSHNA